MQNTFYKVFFLISVTNTEITKTNASFLDLF